jgi:hypothetical protein
MHRATSGADREPLIRKTVRREMLKAHQEI